MKITDIQITHLGTLERWDDKERFLGFDGIFLRTTGRLSNRRIPLQLTPTPEETAELFALIKKIEHRFNTEE